MRKRLVVISGAISLCALTINAQQTPDDFEFKPDQTVYVIAIKTWGAPDLRMRRLLQDYNRERARRRGLDARMGGVTPYNHPMLSRLDPEAPTLERSVSEPDSLTSTDLDLKEKIESEFRKRKKFRLVTSAQAADVVLFAIGRYQSFRFQSNAHGITGAGISGEAIGDNLVSVVAYAIPSPVYRSTKKDLTDLGNVACWEGVESGEVTVDASAGRRHNSVKEAPVKDLVEAFHKDAMKKKNAGAPVVQPRSQQTSPSSSQTPSAAEKKAPTALTPEQDSAKKAAPAEPPPGAVTLKIETSLVIIPVSVLDRDGRYIPDLKRPDFQIYENDVKQEIDHFSAVEEPFHLVMLLDTSDSAHFRIVDIQNAALAFVEQLRPQDRVMIVSFDSRIYVNSEFTSDRDQLRLAINGIRTRAGTRLYDAVDLALSEGLKQFKGRKAIVLFTDGVDTESRISNPARTLELIEESGALLYTVQFNTGIDAQKGATTFGPAQNRISIPNASIPDPIAYDFASRYLAALTERAGGRLYPAENLSNLTQSFSLIANELRRQYSISYYPMNTVRDGSYRRIRITVSRPNVVVRARAGYRATSDTPRQ